MSSTNSKLTFLAQDQKHELSISTRSSLDGRAGRNGGDTPPRLLIRAIVNVVDRRSAKRSMTRLLAQQASSEAFDNPEQAADTVEKRQTLQTSTFFGKKNRSRT